MKAHIELIENRFSWDSRTALTKGRKCYIS